MIELVDLINEKARRNLLEFIKLTDDRFINVNWHHELICKCVQDFLNQNIKKKLAVFIPPQHSKTTIIGEALPCWLLGKNPNLNIVGASYSHNLAKKTNRLIQRKIDSKAYNDIFPKTTLNRSNIVTSSKGAFLRNAEQFEIVDFNGSYKAVGVGGGLTGNPADLIIIDDVVKDSVSASSTTIQARNWDWAKEVAETRMHNDSKMILIMTRWDINDLAGMYLRIEPEEWVVLILPAIKEDNNNPLDPRKIGESLWSWKHNAEKILKVKKSKPKTYQSLYQQNPKPSEDLLIINNHKLIDQLPNNNQRYIGIDFGFSNSQLGVVEIEIDNKRKVISCNELIYETGITNSVLKKKLHNLGITNEFIYCDSAEPKSIMDLRTFDDTKINFRNVIGVKKFPNSVLTQILFLQEYELQVTNRSTNLIYECNNWGWKTDAEGKPTNTELDKYNHLTKAIMYALYASQKQQNKILGYK